MVNMNVQERGAYAGEKVLKMLRWLLVSGVLSYLTTALLEYISGTDLDGDLKAILLILFNTILYGIAKFNEGEEAK